MGSTTTWNRLEPVTRSADLPGLAARVADPLWMVGLQAASGELDGSDTETPVSVRLRYEVAPIDRWCPGTAAAGPARAVPAGVPIEALVDPVAEPVGLRDRAEAGRRFLRWFGAAHVPYLDVLRREFPLADLTGPERAASDPRSRRWAEALAGRGIDGAALREALEDPDEVRARVAVSAVDRPAFDVAAAELVRWWDRRHAVAEGAWRSDRLAAPFTLGAGSTTVVAPEHRGGRVDWHSFDLGATALGPPGPVSEEELSVLPTQLSYPGMPSSTWWQCEDGAVDLGRLEAAPTDLARLLLAEFALVYGNDFFVVPLTLPAGSICRITCLEVRGSFTAEPVPILPADLAAPAGAARRWRMFQLGDGAPDTQATDDGAGLLVLPPCAVDVLDGPTTEEVLLVTDEMANLAWGIERRVVGPAGLPLERRDVEAAREGPGATPPSTDSTLRYRLSTTVPESWLPLEPSGTTLDLRALHPPAGHLLGEHDPFRLDASALPHGGRRVTRAAHRARDGDARVHTWASWTVRPGHGEGSSGLRHDDLTHERPQ